MTQEWLEKPNIPGNSEGERLSGEQKNVSEALEKVESVNIFGHNYLKGIKVVISSNQEKANIFENGIIGKADMKEFSALDFMHGKRTDFVGISPKDEFMDFNFEDLDDKHFLPFLFFNGKFTYEEFVAHEIAHNIFDKQYKLTHGEYEIHNNLTDVSGEYREYILHEVIDLIGSKYPKLELDKFSFNRQQIAEIFAYMYQREYCFRANENVEVHSKLRQRSEEFLSDPKKALADFNRKNRRNCSLLDFYEENHILSLLVVPLLEEKYPDFKKRLEFFNLKNDNKY